MDDMVPTWWMSQLSIDKEEREAQRTAFAERRAKAKRTATVKALMATVVPVDVVQEELVSELTRKRIRAYLSEQTRRREAERRREEEEAKRQREGRNEWRRRLLDEAGIEEPGVVVGIIASRQVWK